MKQVEEDKGVLQNEIALRKLSDQKIANIQVDLRKVTNQLMELEANRCRHDVGGGQNTVAVIATQVKHVKDDLVKMVNQRTNAAPATSPVTYNTLLGSVSHGWKMMGRTTPCATWLGKCKA
jgi:hypothetical protein